MTVTKPKTGTTRKRAPTSKQPPKQTVLQKAEPVAQTTEYACLRRIRHNGRVYGKTIHLPDEDAAPLLAGECVSKLVKGA